MTNSSADKIILSAGPLKYREHFTQFVIQNLKPPFFSGQIKRGGGRNNPLKNYFKLINLQGPIQKKTGLICKEFN